MEGRKIPKDKFIDQYYQARDNVNCLKKEFGHLIQVDLLVKNIDGSVNNADTDPPKTHQSDPPRNGRY